MPPKVVFTEKEITQTALELVDKEGWKALTAQGIARKLKSSVQPIYSNNKSLSDLKRKVLIRIVEMSEAGLKSELSPIYIINSVLTSVTFSIEHPNLIKATFEADKCYHDLFTSAHAESYEKVKADKFFEGVAEQQLWRLYVHTLIYSHGLSEYIQRGYFNHYPHEDKVRMARDGIESFIVNITGKTLEEIKIYTENKNN